MEDGIKYLIGGDTGPLLKALAESEKRMQESGRRSISIIQKLADEEVRIHKSALEQEIHLLHKKGEAHHQQILEEVKDRKAAEALMLKNAEQIEKQIEQVRKTYRDKKIAEIESSIAKEAKAEADAAKKAAAERERIEHEANERIARGRAALAGGMAAIFASLSVGAGTAIKAFADFEGTLNQMAAVSNLTAKEFEEVKAVALAMGAQTKYSAVEAAQGMAELAKAGFTAREAMSAIPGVLSLAAAAGSSVGQAAAIAGGALQAFGLAADQAGHVADVLAKAANISSVDVKDLGDSFKNVAPLARASGQSLEEVTTALAVMGDNLIKSGEAGTAMKAALVILLNPSKDAQAAMAHLGLSIQDTAGKMLPLSDIVDQLRTKTAKMTEVQRASTIANIFGNDAVAGMLALMNKGLPAYDRTAKALRNVSGAAEEMAATMNRGLGASFEQLSGSVDTLFIQFGEQLAPAVKTAAEYLTALANAIAAMDPTTKTLITSVAVATAAFAGLTVAAVGFNAAWPLLTAGLVAITALSGPAVATIGALALAVGGLTAASKLNADANRDAAIKAEEWRKGLYDATATALEKKRALEQLVSEHDRLIDKTSRTAAENEQLHDLDRRMKEQYPQLAAAIAQAGDSHWRNIPAINAETTALWENARARLTVARMNASEAQQAATNATTKLSSLVGTAGRQSRYDATMGKGDAAAAGRAGFSMAVNRQMLGQTNRDIDSAAAESVAADKKAATARNFLKSMESQFAAPAAPGRAKVNRGGGILPPAGRHRGGGGRSAGKDTGAEKAARDRAEAMDNALDAITLKYADLAALSSAAGETQDKRVELLVKEAQEIHAHQLSWTERGVKRLHDIGLQVGTSRIKDKKEAADKAQELAELAIDQKFDRQRAKSKSKGKDKLGAAPAAELRKAAEAIEEMDTAAEHGRDAVRALIGDLAALFADPSQERWANFFKSIVQDEGRVRKVAEAIASVHKAATAPAAGADGFASALGQIGRMLDPVSLALTGLGLVFNGIGKQMAEAKRIADDYKQTLSDIADIRAESSGRLDDQTVRQIEKLNEQEAAELKPLREAYGFNPFFTPEQNDEQFRMSKEAQAKFAKYDALRRQVWDGYDAEMAIRADTSDLWAYSNGKLDEQNAKYGTEGAKYGLVTGQGALSEADAKNLENLEKYVELSKELDEGGRDDFGRKVSLQAELDLQIAEARGDAEKRIADLEAERLKVREEIAALAAEEAKSIDAIRRESIAVRAETETQSKQRRIEEVQADFAKRRTDLASRETELNADIAAAQREKEQSISRINILGRERIDNLNAERAKIEEVTSATDRLLAVERARVQGGSVKSSSSGRSSGQSPASTGEVRANLAGDGTSVQWDGRAWNVVRRHGGGPVPGYPGQEVPIIAQAGEHVITASDLAAWRAGVVNAGATTPAPSGGVVIHIGGVRVDAAGGDVGNPAVAARLANQLAQVLGGRIRQGGHRRI